MVYVAKFEGTVYALHSFQKKTQNMKMRSDLIARQHGRSRGTHDRTHAIAGGVNPTISDS
jgi:phage-related protein